MNEPLDFAVKLSLQAGALLRQFYNPAGIQSSPKPDRTVVTQADFAADQLITAVIHEQFPLDEVISEESSHRLANISPALWIVDPLDGTTNFSLGLSIWGVSIARISNGFPELGVLYFPMIDELYVAQKGRGAFLNNKPITARAPDPIQTMSFFACCSRTFRNYDISIPYKPRIMGSSAYSFCMVARGSALLGFDATPKIWDLAAIWVVVEEAGGTLAAFEGSSPFPVSPQKDYSVISYPTLAAANPEVFKMGQNKIQRKTKFASNTQIKE